jgi:hypothetical protein
VWIFHLVTVCGLPFGPTEICFHRNEVWLDPRANIDSVDIWLGLIWSEHDINHSVTNVLRIIMLGFLPSIPIRSHGMLLNSMETNIFSYASRNVNVIQLIRRPIDPEQEITSFSSQSHTTFLKEK